MKTAILFLSAFVLLSCSGSDSLFGIGGDTPTPPQMSSGVILAPASTGTLAYNLYSANGTSMNITPNDRFRVRFYTPDHSSHETDIGAVSSLGQIFSGISSACNAYGTTASVVPDTNQSGALVLTTSGNPITTLLVENYTNSISNAQVQKTFVWKWIKSSETKSEGRCLTYASSSSPFHSLRDSSGHALGLEPNDIIRVRGKTSQGSFRERNCLTVDSSGTQGLSALFSLISTEIPGSNPALGSPEIPTEAGRITITIPETENTTTLFVQLAAEDKSSIDIVPTYFNSTMVFK